MFYIGIAVVIAIVLLLLLVFAAPALMVSTSPGGGSGALTYDQARPIADRTAAGFAGGGWALLVSAGLVSPVAETAPLPTGSLSSLHCTFTVVSGTGNFTLPAYSGNRSSGAAPAWEFVYRNASGGVALVSVVNGQGEVLGTFSGGECSLLFALFAPVPSNVIDSSLAAAAVAPYANAFLSGHANASAEFGLVGGILAGSSSRGPEWSIAYSTCALSSTATGTGAVFNATVNATSGRVISFSTVLSEACGSRQTPYSLSNSLVFGSAVILTHPPFTNATFQVDQASNGIAWDNLTAQVQNGSAIVPNGWTLTAVTASNMTIATFDPSTQLWSSGGTTAIAAGDRLLLSATVSVSGDTLQLIGAGQFGGTAALPL
jgi:hypothetical protein